MDNEDRSLKERKKVFEIIIKGHTYKLPHILFVGIYDSYRFIEAIPDLTYKEKFLRWLIDNGSSDDHFVPSVEELSAIDDIEFQKYIESFIAENDFLREKYNESLMADNYERFWCAIEPSLVASLSMRLSELGEAANKPKRQFIDDSLSAISQLGKAMLSSIKEALSGFDYSALLKNITDSLLSVSNYLSDIVESIHIPTISEERKRELERSYKTWGEYGWTINPFADDCMFDAAPQNLQEADKIALQYCDTKAMDDLFGMILQRCKRKNDLEEAIACYKNKHYKASAMILFSLIESILIRKQGKSTHLKTGVGAILLYKQDFEESHDLTKKLFTSLNKINLFKCMFVLFDDTSNFTKECPLVNRNYLDHGMTSKRVRKKDCIKLYLLLFNLINFINNHD